MTDSLIGPSLGPLFAGFESIGDNCEFGLVQRAAGIEPLSLLRLSSVPISPLLKALETGFKAFHDDPKVELFETEDHEYMVRVQPYGFSYHTGRFTNDVTERELHAQQAKVVPFLVAKMLADLASAEKIFVRKGGGSNDDALMRRLSSSMQRYGPAVLLVVVPETDLRPAGTIENLQGGLLKGYIDQFAPYDDAGDFSPVWRELCFNATMASARTSAASPTLLSRQPARVRNLLKVPCPLSARRGRVRLDREITRANAIPEIAPGGASISHRLEIDVNSYDIATCSYVSTSVAEPGTFHVASVCVWIPEGSVVSDVCIMMEGFRTLFVQPVDVSLRDVWQRVAVTTAIPPDQQTATVSLFVLGKRGCEVVVAHWRLERGSLPTTAKNRNHDLYVNGFLQSQVEGPSQEGCHETITISDLMESLSVGRIGHSPASFKMAEARAWYGAEWPLDLGADPGRKASGCSGPVSSPRSTAPMSIRLRGAKVHGSSGAVTLGGLCLAESIAAHLESTPRATASRLPPMDRLAAGSLACALHLLPQEAECYADWLISSLSRFEASHARGLGPFNRPAGYSVLTRPADAEWKEQLLSLLIPDDIERVVLRPGVHLCVEDLLYTPPSCLPAVSSEVTLGAQRLRASAYRRLSAQQNKPWRKLFLFSGGGCARSSANLSTIAAKLEQQGFETLPIEATNLAETIQAFSEASHVISFPTECLANIIFCAPRTFVRQLPCGCHSPLPLARVASLNDLDYCLVNHLPDKLERFSSPS